MAAAFDDHSVRLAAFSYLDDLHLRFGRTLPWKALKAFVHQGVRVPLIGAAGIWKPKCLDIPISITTSPTNPYGDTIDGADGLLRYRYQSSAARQYDNEGLRRAMAEARPLIYFHGVERGLYIASWPAVITADSPSTQTFTVAIDDVQSARPDLSDRVAEEVRRAYTTRLAVQRLHQSAFRQKVLRAYKQRCTICNIGHVSLLDAAHILPDKHEQGDPIVPNGLAMCKIHHAAFDANILGIRPDNYRIEIRTDILTEVDGPMLKHGLQAHHGGTLILPRSEADKPDPDRIEIRYDAFKKAS